MQDIAWEPYKSLGQLSDRDLAIIRRVDKSTETAKVSVLDEVRCVFTSRVRVRKNIAFSRVTDYKTSAMYV